MLDVALKIFFAGFLLVWVVHPYAGVAVMGLAVTLLFWELWAFMALPFLWVGTKLLQAWARMEATERAAKP